MARENNENQPLNPRLQAAEAELDAARQVLKDANQELKDWKANTTPRSQPRNKSNPNYAALVYERDQALKQVTEARLQLQREEGTTDQRKKFLGAGCIVFS
jgi:hypothetical protein